MVKKHTFAFSTGKINSAELWLVACCKKNHKQLK